MTYEYQGYVEAGRGVLLGGVRVHRTSWQKLKKDARALVELYVRENRKAGRDPHMWGVRRRAK